MMSAPPVQPRFAKALPWLVAGLGGIAGPAIAMALLSGSPAPLVNAIGPVTAVGMMAGGMITAAAAGRLHVGLGLGVAGGAGLVLLALALGMPAPPQPLLTGLAVIIASTSFAARGALFARSAADKGWWIALGVIGGEAAVVLTAAATPGALPGWLLALLPAQWASAAIQTSISGPGTPVAVAELAALGATAAATLLVARLWPRRWPYLIMFGTWIAMSALVWHWPSLPLPS